VSAAHFFVPSVTGDVIRIDGDEGRHAVRVLRVRAGEDVTISDGAGSIADARATAIDGATLVCEVHARRHLPQPRPAVHLFCAVPKSGKLELVVQKATELGVAEISPWFASRSIPRWGVPKSAAHAQRLRAIAYAAAKQSRRAWLPHVVEPAALPDTLPAPAFALHEEASLALRDALPERAPERLSLVVGPEGGLGSGDLQVLIARGAEPVSLGALILRAETAAIVGPALVMWQYGLMG